MTARKIAAVLFALAFSGTASRPAWADTDARSPDRAYVAAVAAMRALEVPATVTYRSAWASTGAGFTFVQDGSRIVLQVGLGRAFAQRATYALSFRTADRVITLDTATEHLSGTGSRLLDPTFSGAYDILRYGLHGEAPVAAASPAAEPAPAASAPPVIASVVAIAPAFYAVTDGGAGACPNGNAGRVLSLHAYRDPRAHPLTEVTIDASDDRFCSMRFNVDQPGVASVTGDYEIHFAEVGPYWLVSGGFADVSARVMGIAARRVVVRWENSDIATPPVAGIDSPKAYTPGM